VRALPSKRRGFAGCVRQYCYCREKKYYPYEDPKGFAYHIEVKENAPDLPRQALSRAPVDVVGTGDYQPAEARELVDTLAQIATDTSSCTLERTPVGNPTILHCPHG
jgi:hypothetical protein